MDEQNILDHTGREEDGLRDKRIRWRALRMLLYSMGVIGLVYFRIYSTPYGMLADGAQRLLVLGVASVWFFAGLGSVATVQAVRAGEPIDWMVIIAALGNGILLLISTVQLANYFLF